jgi:hypothetical protein
MVFEPVRAKGFRTGSCIEPVPRISTGRGQQPVLISFVEIFTLKPALKLASSIPVLN